MGATLEGSEWRRYSVTGRPATAQDAAQFLVDEGTWLWFMSIPGAVFGEEYRDYRVEAIGPAGAEEAGCEPQLLYTVDRKGREMVTIDARFARVRHRQWCPSVDDRPLASFHRRPGQRGRFGKDEDLADPEARGIASVRAGRLLLLVTEPRGQGGRPRRFANVAEFEAAVIEAMQTAGRRLTQREIDMVLFNVPAHKADGSRTRETIREFKKSGCEISWDGMTNKAFPPRVRWGRRV